MKASADKRFVTVLFGSLGDALMALAFFDDLLKLAPDATLLILTRRNAELLRALAREYPQIKVREIPRGLRAAPFFARLLARRYTLLTLGLVSIGYSLPLRLFFLMLRLAGSRTIGFHDKLLQVRLDFDISKLMIDNLRRLLPYGLPGTLAPAGAPSVRLPQDAPRAAPQGPYVVAHLFGASISNALPPHRWRSMIGHVLKKYPACRIVLTGSPHEHGRLADIAQGFSNVEMRTDLSISELAYLVGHAALYIGIDTGVTHIAGVLQKESVIVRHCGDPTWMPSYNPNAAVLFDPSRCMPEDPLNCAIVGEEGVGYRRCAYDISDEALFGAIDRALSAPEALF
jgi:heptosyltransferase-3